MIYTLTNNRGPFNLGISFETRNPAVAKFWDGKLGFAIASRQLVDYNPWA